MKLEGFHVSNKLVTSLKATVLHKGLQNMVSHSTCLFREAKRTGNWDLLNMFHKKFITHLKKCNNFFFEKKQLNLEIFRASKHSVMVNLKKINLFFLSQQVVPLQTLL